MAFGRKYELVVANPLTFIEGVDGLIDLTSLDIETIINRQLFSQDPDFILTQHHISFNIAHGTGGSGSAQNKLTITNPPERLVAKFGQDNTSNMVIQLKAGYETRDNPPKLIFKGTVTKYSHIKEGNIDQLILTLSDSVNLKEARTVKKFSKNTPVNDIISELVADLGFNVNFITPIPDDPILKSTYYCNGNTLCYLDRLLKRYKYKATWSNYEISILPVDGMKVISGVSLSDKTGTIIGSPTYENDVGDVKQNNTEMNNTSVKVKTLLNGDIRVDNTIRLDTEKFKDSYVKVTSVTHSGEFEGNAWYTTLTVEKVKEFVTTEVTFDN